MTLFARLRSWLFGIAHRSTVEREMDEELRFHVESYAADLVREGVSPAEAQRRARAEFGGIEARKEDCREARGLRLVDEARGDVRYALRQLRCAPVFTAVAILSLAVGIGANTAIFSLMEQALWKALPVRAPEELRLLTWVSGPKKVNNSESGDWSRNNSTTAHASTAFSYVTFQTFQQQTTAFDSLFAFKPIGVTTAIVDGHAELIRAELVSGSFFAGLGVVPIMGRAIEPADDAIGREIVAVISDGWWTRRFARDPAVVGEQIRINQVPVTVVGVSPPGFAGMESGTSRDIFLPITAQPLVAPWRYSKTGWALDNPDYWWVQVMGRLKPSVSDAEAQSATQLLLQESVRATLPDRMDRDQPQLRLLTGSRGLDNLREEFRRPLLVLLSLVTLVLWIACANVANLLLARAAARRRELSLRLALGAGRWRIARQLLTEGLTLSVGGGLLGVLIGYWTRNTIPRLLASPWTEPRVTASFGTRVLLLTLAVTVVTSVFFSLAPIWQSLRAEINEALKDGGRAATTSLAPLRAKSLIVFQVGLSVLLLIGAGLFVRTLVNLQSVDLGFQSDRILLFDIDPPRNRYADHKRRVLLDRLQEGVAAIPGIESASLSWVPLVADGSSTSNVGLNGELPTAGNDAWVNDVGYRFMETMAIPIFAGRSFNVHDREDSPSVVIVNRQFVRRFFPNENYNAVLGKTLYNNNRVYEIVGICGDTHYDRARGAVPATFYRLFTQAQDSGSMTFELRTPVATAAIIKSVRQVFDDIDKDLPIYDVRTQAEQIDATVSRERLFATLTAAFGVLALLLASIGIYGVMAHNVARRTGEIGIRIALGAQRLEVLLMVLREASGLAMVGVVVGVAAAVWLARYVKSMLFGVQPVDPITIGGAIVLMLLVALIAGWLPARRASRLDPMVALRHE